MSRHSRLDAFATADDWAACQALLWTGSRTFMAASLLLPPRVRQAAVGIYAFCRTADDAVDGGGDSRAALAELERRLERIYAGTPQGAADRAFADVIARHDIPRAHPAALLEGFAWDAAGRRYESFDDLGEYAMRVAGVVGAMMAMVMGVRDDVRMARACDLGVAMQLTNIARDVGEDARNGRVYLPLQWLREADIDVSAWLQAPRFDARLATVIERVLAAADGLYRRSESGLRVLPATCRTGMYAARYLYAHIGEEVRRRGCDSIAGRAVVRPLDKGRLVGKAMLATVFGAPTGSPRPELAQRVDGVLDLFERLARRDGGAGSRSPAA